MTRRRRATDRAITVAEAAKLLGRSRATVRRMISEGHLPAVPLGTGKRPPLVVRRKDVQRARDWLEAERALAGLPTVDLPQVPPDDPRLRVPDSVKVRQEVERERQEASA